MTAPPTAPRGASRSTDAAPLEVPPGEVAPGAIGSGTTDPSIDSRSLLRLWPGWREAACIALLYAATVQIAAQDGGGRLESLFPAFAIAALVMIATAPTLARMSLSFRWMALAWIVGPLLSLGFAEVRAGWVLPVVVASLGVPVFLATLHLLRKRWGATVIAIIVAAGGLRAWTWAGFVWYGGGSNNKGEPAWMALAWHNQSGTLMGALGVGALGVAIVRAGPTRVVSILIAAAGLSGAWLSGSRGAVLMTAAGCVVILIAGVRRGDVRRLAFALVATSALTAAAIAGLGAIYGGVGLDAQPVLSRSQDAGANAGVRVDYWRAAAGMAVHAPLTGTGPGSFRWSSVRFYPDDRGLTGSAHNEPLEMVGELGVVGAVAGIFLTLGLVLLVLRTMARLGPPMTLEVAAAGVGTLLLGHAAIDFDWNYPILLVLLAIAAAVLVASADALGSTQPEAPSSPSGSLRLHAVIIALAVLLLGTAGAGVAVQTRGGAAPWELDQRLLLAANLAERGDRAEAERHLSMVRRWNPGAPRLDAVDALVRHHAGLLDDASLAAHVEPRSTAFHDQLRIAGHLARSERTDLAAGILDRMRPVLEDRRAWGVQDHVTAVVSLALDIAFMEEGCAEVRRQRPEATSWASERGVDDVLTRIRTDRRAPAPAWVSCDLPGDTPPA